MVVKKEIIPILRRQTIRDVKLVTIHRENILAVTDDALTEQCIQPI